VRLAERNLAAQSAIIGVATADLYPIFSLSGDLGLAAEHFSGLWQGNSFQAFAGPSFRWAILNYGRIENNIRVQDAAYQALVSEYESVVLRAQGEVEAAVAGFVGAQKQVVSLRQSVAASEKAVELAEQQYRGGIADYTRVLNTQEFLTTEQSRLVATRGTVALNLVAIYRALGGGWELRKGQALVPAEIKDQMKQRTNWGKMIDTDHVP
jgi:outer membrane protein TolC